MIVQSPAIVLKSFPYGETSLIVRCFTREMGKLSFIAKGARRKKSNLIAAIQPTSYLDLVFYYRSTRDLQTISKANFVETWNHLQDDLKRISYSLSVVELTNKTLTDHDPHERLFDELVDVLRAFDRREAHLNLVFWYYEMRLLTILGFKPDLSRRHLTGIDLPDPQDGPNSLHILKTLRDTPLKDIGDMEITARDRKVISDYLTLQLQYHFDGLRELKSFQVLRQLLT